MRLVWILTLLLSPALSASADVVLMKNGDRITGAWERVEEGRLFLKSEMLGAVSVPVAKIQVFSFPGTTIVIAGMTLVREQQIAGVDRQNAEALAGAKLTFDVWSRNTVHHAFNFYPNFTGRYRLDTTTALTTRIWPRVTMNITLVDRYVSRAQPERTRNELVLTTGFGVRF